MGHSSETTSPFPKVLPRSCFKLDHESSNDIKIARVISFSLLITPPKTVIFSFST